MRHAIFCRNRQVLMHGDEPVLVGGFTKISALNGFVRYGQQGRYARMSADGVDQVSAPREVQQSSRAGANRGDSAEGCGNFLDLNSSDHVADYGEAITVKSLRSADCVGSDQVFFTAIYSFTTRSSTAKGMAPFLSTVSWKSWISNLAPSSFLAFSRSSRNFSMPTL